VTFAWFVWNARGGTVEVPQWLGQLWNLIQQLWSFLRALWAILVPLLPILLWAAFWLFAVDWRKLWPVLRAGAWAPCVLLGLMAALVWSRLAPGKCDCLGLTPIPNFWWQLGSVGLLAGIALFAGWLQGQLSYVPPEIAVEPPADHGHGHHGHGHH
jgi:hypothetical protein